VGHWYEVPNLLRNGVLRALLEERPRLKYIMLHNIDTLGANLDPGMLGLHIDRGSALTFEVITRRVDDRGGGLARANGRVRLIEGLAIAARGAGVWRCHTTTRRRRGLSWTTYWGCLDWGGGDLGDEARVGVAIRELGARMPTYVTVKDVKKRWGHGQEDTYPVVQWEKLWSDMAALPEAKCGFVVVPRPRGQQLKEQSQLDGWLRDGSAAAVEALCDWG